METTSLNSTYMYLLQLLSGVKDLMAECWYEDGDARNQILFYKAKLLDLAREDKIEYDVQE